MGLILLDLAEDNVQKCRIPNEFLTLQKNKLFLNNKKNFNIKFKDFFFQIFMINSLIRIFE